jgi:hypothetical protein
VKRPFPSLTAMSSWLATNNRLMQARSFFRLVLAVLLASAGLNSVRAVGSIHYGIDGMDAYPNMTDAIRLSTRIGYTWWVSHAKKYNPENSAGIPYGHLRKLGKNLGIAAKEMEEEANNVYEASNENLPVGTDAGIL